MRAVPPNRWLMFYQLTEQQIDNVKAVDRGAIASDRQGSAKVNQPSAWQPDFNRNRMPEMFAGSSSCTAMFLQ
jgi:hypothetical protein